MQPPCSTWDQELRHYNLQLLSCHVSSCQCHLIFPYVYVMPYYLPTSMSCCYMMLMSCFVDEIQTNVFCEVFNSFICYLCKTNFTQFTKSSPYPCWSFLLQALFMFAYVLFFLLFIIFMPQWVNVLCIYVDKSVW